MRSKKSRYLRLVRKVRKKKIHLADFKMPKLNQIGLVWSPDEWMNEACQFSIGSFTSEIEMNPLKRSNRFSMT